MNDMAGVSLHQLTVTDYHRIAEIGLFDHKRFELLDGIIVKMSPIGGHHWRCHAAATESRFHF